MIKDVGIEIKENVNVRNLLINVAVMIDLFGLLVYVNENMINHAMLKYGNCKFRKRLIDKLMLECKDEILNTTDTISIANKKVTLKTYFIITLFH